MLVGLCVRVGFSCANFASHDTYPHRPLTRRWMGLFSGRIISLTTSTPRLNSQTHPHASPHTYVISRVSILTHIPLPYSDMAPRMDKLLVPDLRTRTLTVPINRSTVFGDARGTVNFTRLSPPNLQSSNTDIYNITTLERNECLMATQIPPRPPTPSLHTLDDSEQRGHHRAPR